MTSPAFLASSKIHLRRKKHLAFSGSPQTVGDALEMWAPTVEEMEAGEAPAEEAEA
ncbi:hypothetical protein [Deinococcus gobiensis]|uniref:Uncharacterized protein n=1 Tax=Deinococcus gobiensis (strain DSM 21396 / JCM 16679 / CGMCC 1.7299 / I-0) TaxID=745776 RepID=H8H3P5_DEIGI|nr:hypothetical protein [Deinococcus gobiensis]AFD28142.1 hypothetical protein DGo_PD0068 [Deinococcus gobiensis I-0]